MKAICDRDCFNCPHPDCMVDDITLDEYREIKERDDEMKLLNSSMSRNQVLAKRAYTKARYQRKKDELVAYQRAYDAANKDKIKACKKLWYAANKERVLTQQREYRKVNQARYRAYHAAYRAAKKQQKETLTPGV